MACLPTGLSLASYSQLNSACPLSGSCPRALPDRALCGWNLAAADCKRMAACVKPDKSVILGTAAAQELLDWDVAHGDKTLKQ